VTNLKKGYVCRPAEQLSYAYNRSQQDALRARISQLYFGKKLYMFRTDLLSIIRSIDTVFKATAICHTGYVDCLLARSSECQIHKQLSSFYSNCR
jgi:hypothetical protein